MITIGDTIILEVVEGNEELKRYKSKILDIEADMTYTYIDLPIEEGDSKPVFLLKNNEYKMYVFTKDQLCYSFQTEVIEYVRRNITLVKLSFPGMKEMKLEQKRVYARVDCENDVAIHPFNGLTPFTTVSTDFSAGGISIKVSNRIHVEIGDRALLWIVIPFQNGSIQYLKFESIVRRIILNDKKEKIVAFEYEQVNEQERQVLIRYVFERQLIERNKVGIV